MVMASQFLKGPFLTNRTLRERWGGTFIERIATVGVEQVTNTCKPMVQRADGKWVHQREQVLQITFANGWRFIPGQTVLAALQDRCGDEVDGWVGVELELGLRFHPGAKKQAVSLIEARP
jgi:hypothetical protein